MLWMMMKIILLIVLSSVSAVPAVTGVASAITAATISHSRRRPDMNVIRPHSPQKSIHCSYGESSSPSGAGASSITTTPAAATARRGFVTLLRGLSLAGLRHGRTGRDLLHRLFQEPWR